MQNRVLNTEKNREPVMDNLLTYKEAAKVLDVGPMTVRDLVRRLGIVPKPVPRNGNAKGLDASDVVRIRRALEPTPDRSK